jgi:uncharacterized protein YihD (DUF1040 family)
MTIHLTNKLTSDLEQAAHHCSISPERLAELFIEDMLKSYWHDSETEMFIRQAAKIADDSSLKAALMEVVDEKRFFQSERESLRESINEEERLA